MRFLTLTTIALATALTAGVATAQSVSPGVAQLAATAGVSPNGFTTAQLIRLIDTQRDNDATTVAFILNQAATSGNLSQSSMNSNAGDAQLALSAGVEPGRFTTNELIRLNEAQRNNDDEIVAFILSGSRTNTGGSSAGKAQLAASLGVDASAYTLNELVALQAEMTGRSDS